MIIATEDEMKTLGERIGRVLRGGECIELIGDVGVGKTTFVKGLALGLEIDEDVQSPSFTLSREYDARDGLRVAHYDFYRLSEAGVLSFELAESLADPRIITVVEWAETVHAVLPDDRISLLIRYQPDDESRIVEVHAPENRQYVEAVV